MAAPASAAASERPEADKTAALSSFAEDNSLKAALARGHSVVFFDVAIAGTAVGRITIELFDTVAPRAAENFRQLCTGETRRSGQPIGYKGSPFHRVIPGFMVQGGDIPKGDGTGSLSIYGSRFADEPAGLALRHGSAGMVSMANSGSNTNGCQFFLCMDACPWLDGKHVVVGRLLDDPSLLVSRKLEAVPTVGERPSVEVTVVECGQL